MGNTGYVKAVFLQARISSSRLPGKAFLDLGGKTVLEQSMESLLEIDADHYVLLTDDMSVSQFIPLATKCGFTVFSGAEDDVLKRYTDAAEKYNPDYIIRATGDNPLVSAALAEELYTIHLMEYADYSGYLGMPLGAGVEVISTPALLDAASKAVDVYDREHVCPYLYNNDDVYTINRLYVDDRFHCPKGRITLDTREDYLFIQNIYKKLYKGSPIHIIDVIDYLNDTKQFSASSVSSVKKTSVKKADVTGKKSETVNHSLAG